MRRDIELTPPKLARQRAGRSRMWVAVMAGVSEPLAKLFEEAGPEAIATPAKRAALARVYRRLQTETASGGAA